MKAIKKQCKAYLLNLAQLATELSIVCSDLSALAEVQQLAISILQNANLLSAQISGVKKAELKAIITESEAWENLEECLDMDIISNLEESFFRLLENNAEHQAGDFFQEFLAKIDQRFSQIIACIQAISDVLEDDE